MKLVETALNRPAAKGVKVLASFAVFYTRIKKLGVERHRDMDISIVLARKDHYSPI